MTTSTMMIITNHFNHHFFFFLYIQITMFSLVQHSTDIQGTSESGLRHNLPVARLRLTGGPTRGKRLDQREIWRDGLEEGKTLSSPANRPICSYARRNALNLPPLVGLPTIHCRRTLHVLPQSRGYNSNPFNNKSRPVHHSPFE